MFSKSSLTKRIKDERPANRYSLSLMARLFHLKPMLPDKGKVLEVGCGEGFISEILVKDGCQVTGIDYSSEAIRKASRLPGKYLNVNLYDYKPRRLFDWVICSEVLEHLDNDHLALKMMYSWLKPGGKLLLSVPTFMKLTPRLKMIGGHQRHYYPEKLIKMTEEAGFLLEKKKEWGCLIRRLILSCLPGISQGKPKKLLVLMGVILKPLVLLDAFFWPFPDSIILVLRKPK